MAFIKSYLIPLVCGLISLVFIAVAVLGLMSEAVEEKATQRVQIASALNGLTRDTRNQNDIEVAQAEATAIESAFERAIKIKQDVNRRDVLMEGTFPSVSNTATTAYEYANQYVLALRELQRRLNGGPPPDDDDIEEAENDIDILEKDREAEQGDDPLLPESADSGPRPGMGDPGRDDDMRDDDMRDDPAPRRSDRDDDEERDPTFDPEYRAALTRALQIFMYVDRRALHIVPIIDRPTPPAVEELWYAQMTLWVQQDIVEAIAQINDKAAEAIGPSASVLNLPIKRIEQMRVAGYVDTTGKMIEFPDRNAPRASDRGRAQNAPPSFTARMSDQMYDVVRFNVVIWVDQRRVNQVIDAISTINLYQCIGARFTAAEKALDRDELYLFGSDPVVRLELEFEGYFTKSIFTKWIPKGVADTIAGVLPDPNSRRR